MISKTYENMPLAVRRSLALTVAAVAFAGCGGKTNGNEVPAGAQQKPNSAEVQPKNSSNEARQKPKSVTNTEAAETNKSQEVVGSPDGFPLEIVITHKGGDQYELLVSNTNDVDAGTFVVLMTALNKELAPLVMNPELIDAEGHEIKENRVKSSGPNPIEASAIYSIIPGLEAGDTLKIDAEIPEAESIYLRVEPSDPEAELRWSDKVYSKPTDN